MSQKFDDHAAAPGARVGGLLAARVLTDAYRQLTILERDLLPESARHAMALGILGEDDDIGALPCRPSPADLPTPRVLGLGRRSVAGGAAWGS